MSDRFTEALHRYNSGPDWTRAECVELVSENERLLGVLQNVEGMLRSDFARQSIVAYIEAALKS